MGFRALFGGVTVWPVFNRVNGCFFAGGLAEASVEEFAGGGYAVVGFERSQLSFHDVDEEACYGASVVGVFADYPC